MTILHLLLIRDMIEIRLWQYGSDNLSIPSFLEGMSVAHHEPIRTEEWFHWKFEGSPYGKTILACAFDGIRVAGCVAYGNGIVKYKGKDWKCALSYETFVHPDYQGKGLFKKLISLAEAEMKKEGVQFLYNFPNANSITGFKHMNWTCRNDIKMFKIKPLRLINLALHVMDLRKIFQPLPFTSTELKNINLADIPIEQTIEDIITPIWTVDYLKWRFFTNPSREYFVINNVDYFSIAMVGYRGKLKVVRHLYSISKKGLPTSEIMNAIIKRTSKDTKADVYEYSSTIFDNSLSKCHLFISAPTHSNFCYKFFGEDMFIDDFKITLPSINAHTY